jgi:hypothetical protein
MLIWFWLLLGPATLPPDVHLMRDRHLQIPIRVNESRRNDLVELVLYVSSDQGRTWTGAGKAKPTQEAFNFHADKDGLYWFSVQAVDREGRYDPPDIAQVSPALKVMIDTQRALMQILAAERVGDDVVVTWQTLDVQADVNSLKLEYRPADASSPLWQMASITPALSGQARFRPNTNGAVTVRLTMSDQSGVPATVTKDVPGGPTSPAVQQTNSIAPTPPMASPTSLNSNPPSGIGGLPPPAMEPPQPVAAQPVMPPSPPVVPPATTPTPAPPEGPLPGGLAPLAGLRPGEEPSRKPATAPPEFGTTAPPPRNSAAEVQHVHDKQVGLDFEIERKGPSGVKKIETYITPDDGQTWYKWSETGESRSPLQLPMPQKEGPYGFRIVVYSGVMQSDGPPKAGMPPDVRLFVDRTPPQVEWYPPTPDANQANALTLRFSVQDANLDANSVVLQWSRQADTGWQTIAASNSRATPATGVPTLKECTWPLPADIPDAVFLRITARDLAGNIGERITRDAVTVDLHKPMARVKRIVLATPSVPFQP